MPTILPSALLGRLCAVREFQSLVWIAATVEGCRCFDLRSPTYGLPDPAFNLVERLAWFSQGVRSGCWTYFEATPPERQAAMSVSLAADPSRPEFVANYYAGMRGWRVPGALAEVDAWIDANDDANSAAAWEIVEANRETILGIVNSGR